jgi:hypothetical protein
MATVRRIAIAVETQRGLISSLSRANVRSNNRANRITSSRE